MSSLRLNAFGVLTGIVMSVLFTGCVSSRTVVLEYDKDGNLLKRTESMESHVKAVARAAYGKSIIMWDNSWLAGIHVSIFDPESLMPVIKFLVGNNDKGILLMHPDEDPSAIGTVIKNIRAGKFSLDEKGVKLTKDPEG